VKRRTTDYIGRVGVRDGERDSTGSFAGETANFYAKYRRGYPPEFVARLAAVGGDGAGRVLDLGCGTGALLLELAPAFEQAVGIDPEPDMLGQAARAARERGIGNVEWIESSSAQLQELEPPLSRFDLVTIGTAFHFMEPRATLGELKRIAPCGVVAVAYNGTPMWLHPDPWAKALRAVLENRFGRPLRGNDFTDDALDAAERTMHDLSYAHVERWEHTETETIDLDFVIGHILSAISAEQIPSSERKAFAHEVSAAIAAVEPSRIVSETVRARAVIGDTSRP
jgi:ubiquinone/menaquinone biosynthesis C-methylase UbiE